MVILASRMQTTAVHPGSYNHNLSSGGQRRMLRTGCSRLAAACAFLQRRLGAWSVPPAVRADARCALSRHVGRAIGSAVAEDSVLSHHRCRSARGKSDITSAADHRASSRNIIRVC
eukprot:scaffold15653_cov78-Phaeocystis_antarctica.AAC.4